MTDLINKIYFDKIRWILAHLKELDVSSDEIVVILAIVVLNEEKLEVNIESIANLTPLTSKQVDDAITLLAAKRYLEIKVCAGEVSFSIDQIFELKKQVNNDVVDLFKIFEEEFSRLLTQNELVRLNEWISEYDRDVIIESLRNASIMQKLNFNYINRILENSKNE
ncbi:MAG: DnaD domain protein [Erysipelothrix sp.]|nr:DnaD domain protein [Erysipelothrix sp.]